MIIVIIVWYINNLKFVFKVMKIREHGENDVTVEPIRPTFNKYEHAAPGWAEGYSSSGLVGMCHRGF